jgi:ERCC4-type nuclease
VFDHSYKVTQAPWEDDDPDFFLRANLAKELPNIEYKRARAAANTFRSPRAMFNASVADWEKVPGIGRTIATNIVKVIRRESGD